MELFKLLGTIAIDNSSAKKALDETSEKGEKTQSKLSKALSAAGKGAAVAGKAIATGLAAGATAMGALTVKALNLSGELEQNMGGSEAVFGKFADNVQAKAKEAFSQMGLSTSDYLATANKMGALFQGAGFSVEQSMDISSQAMQRAADVASIMGIDTASAMEAVAGAAKGNFTMMDNLGVAMNATTIEAYALSKGIKTSYKDMDNQQKIGLAMEMFLEKTSYATGNYAKENDTLAGSLSTAKAALTNFLDGSGTVESLVDSFINAASVIVDNLKTILPRLVTGISDLIAQLVPLLPPLLQEIFPALIEGAVNLINGLIGQLPLLLDMLINDFLPLLINAAIQITVALIAAFPQLAMQIIAAIPQVFAMIWDAIGAEFKKLNDNVIVPYLNKLKADFNKKWNEIKTEVTNIINNLKTKLSEIWNKIKTNVSNILNDTKTKISNIWNNIKTSVSTAVDNVKSTVSTKFNQIKTAITKPIEEAKTKIKGVVDAIKGFFTNMKLSLPKIKLPHFKVSGKLSIDPPSVPKLSIEWYKKAMGSPILMNEPTIFGYNPSTGSFMGGGEAGSEVVSGTNTLMNMIQNAVANENGAVVYYLQKIIEVLAEYFPQLLDALDATFDGDFFIKKKAPMIDKELGRLHAGKVRGR